MAKAQYELYTDGSCKENVGGYAYGIYQDGVLKAVYSHQYKDTTSNRMELLAILKGLQRFAKTNVHVTVYSDSAYCINCFNERWYKNWLKNGWRTSNRTLVKNKDLWKALITEIENRDITWKHVKGHSGNEKNEKVDELANRARKGENCNLWASQKH